VRDKEDSYDEQESEHKTDGKSLEVGLPRSGLDNDERVNHCDQKPRIEHTQSSCEQEIVGKRIVLPTRSRLQSSDQWIAQESAKLRDRTSERPVATHDGVKQEDLGQRCQPKNYAA
jgi:hypothetical protein